MHFKQPPFLSSSSDAFNYERLIVELFHLSEEMFGQSDGIVERISREITHLSQGYFSVRWHHMGTTPPRSGPLSLVSSVPLQCRGRYYGELVSVVDPAQPTMPLVLPDKAQMVADMCGWLIYSLEVAAFLENQHASSGTFKPLRPREREVLMLMSRQYTEQDIANALHISQKTVQKHQENIYKRLGVHAAHHAVLSGFLNAQYSPLASLTPCASNAFEEEAQQESTLEEG